jgi:hypothetical protein
LAVFVIRRITKSKWNGKRLIPLKSNVYKDIEYPLPVSTAAAINNIDSVLRINMQKNLEDRKKLRTASDKKISEFKINTIIYRFKIYKIRIYAVFPYFQRIADRRIVDLNFKKNI